MVEEAFSKLKDATSIETLKTEKTKKTKSTEHQLQGLPDNDKWCNICVMGIPEERQEFKFRDFSQMNANTQLQRQAAQRAQTQKMPPKPHVGIMFYKL